MRWTDELRIETPEQVGMDLELAGLGSRFQAQVIDWLWKTLATLVLALTCGAGAALLGRTDWLEHPPVVVAAAGVAAAYALWLGYGVFFELRWNGQTPGKRSAGVRAIREGGAPLDAQAAAVRNLLGVADFLPGFFLLGALLILLTARRQRLGDLAAGTLVIRERAYDPGPDPAADLRSLAAPEYMFTRTQLAPLTQADRAILRSFLQRHDDMDPEARSRLGRRLVQSFQARTGHAAPDDDSQARAFLASLLRDLEESLGGR